MGPPKLLTDTFPYECWSWLMLHNFLNPLKQETDSLSELLGHVHLAKWPHARHWQQPAYINKHGFTWESLSPAQVAAISDCFITQAV